MSYYALLQLQWPICIFCNILFQPLDFLVEIWYHKLILIVKIERGRKMFEKVKTLHFESEAFQAPSNYDIFPDSNIPALSTAETAPGKARLQRHSETLEAMTRTVSLHRRLLTRQGPQ